MLRVTHPPRMIEHLLIRRAVTVDTMLAVGRRERAWNVCLRLRVRTERVARRRKCVGVPRLPSWFQRRMAGGFGKAVHPGTDIRERFPDARDAIIVSATRFAASSS